ARPWAGSRRSQPQSVHDDRPLRGGLRRRAPPRGRAGRARRLGAFRLMPARELVVEHRGIKLAVEISGEGEPALLLLHGGGDNLATWAGIAPVLADELRVIAFAAAGH